MVTTDQIARAGDPSQLTGATGGHRLAWGTDILRWNIQNEEYHVSNKVFGEERFKRKVNKTLDRRPREHLNGARLFLFGWTWFARKKNISQPIAKLQCTSVMRTGR